MRTPTPLNDAQLARARTLARALDSAVGIPGTGFRVGLDPLLGLVPGLGDLAGAALSGYIVLTGVRLGASRTLVLRMLANVALDTLAGSVPVVGDLFDAAWKSNNRNIALIEQHVASPDTTRAASRLMIAGVALALLLLAVSGVAAAVLAVRWLLHLSS
ncbi:MAG: DUF4112 domain-containing protein [bacterium]